MKYIGDNMRTIYSKSFIIIICSLALVACGKIDSSDTANVSGDPSQSGQSAPLTTPKPDKNMIRSVNQPAANVIYVREIYLEYPGYVALHRFNNDGSLGDMIGITHAIEGNKEQIDVTINEPVNNGDKLAVVMYQDDGDIEFNDVETDLPVTDENGEVIRSIITIDDTTTPPLEE
jgi:hypothetical protein